MSNSSTPRVPNPTPNEMLPSTSKPSTSNWLDRLRTSKGFPDIAAVDLDHFLTSANPNPDPPPPDLPAPPPSACHPSADTNNRLSDILTNVLADLFIIGPPRPRQTLAEPKKQRCPKQIRVAAAASGVGSFSADNARKLRTKARKREAGGAGDVDLSGYSRTDVTVIDTSLGSWKVEKVIFRKGAVWKVRDRKVRVRFRKRRKVGLVERLVGEKERGEESGSGKTADERSRTHKIDSSRETVDHIQIPLRRLKSSRSPRVPVARDSSIFRLQVISSNMTNGPICASSTPKGT